MTPFGAAVRLITSRDRLLSAMSGEKTKRRGSRIALRRWVEGTPLKSAWFSCASSSLQEEYENTLNDHILSMLRDDMRGEVCKDLRCGKLVAFGTREESTPEETPVQIPAHLFPIDDQSQVTVDWDGSALTGPHGQFVSIRVTRPPVRGPRKARPRPTKGAAQVPAESTSAARSNLSASRRGRPRIDEPLRA